MKLSPIDLNLLVVFDAILRTESVSKAADRVGLSKPAMSHALARLRAQAGDQILVRSGKDWILTERARALAPRIYALVDEARNVLSPESDVDPPKLRREFRLHVTDHVLAILGVAVGHAVTREAPSVNLRFLSIQTEDAPALRSGSVDLAIGVFPGLPAEFRTQRLFNDRFVCVLRKELPGIGGRLSMKQFLALGHVLVAPRGRPGSVVDDALAEMGLVRRVARSVPFFLSALDLVAQSDCVVTLSERLARLHAARFGLRVLAPPLALPDYDICQIWHPRVDVDAAHRWLRRLVARVAKTHAPDLGRSR